MGFKFGGENMLTQLITQIKLQLVDYVKKVEGKGLSTNDYTTEEKSKLENIAANANNYSLPTASSTVKGGIKIGSGFSMDGEVLSVSSGGEADSVKWANVTGKPEKSSNIDTDGTDDTKYTTPKAVKTYVDSKAAAVFKPQGSIAFSALPALSASILGNVYNITNAFNTTSDFLEGAGKSYPAGSNVVCVASGDTYKWDVMSGAVDLSPYAKTEDFSEITADEVQTIWTTVFGS